MTADRDWHALPGVLQQMAHDPIGLDPATAGSVEQHLLVCAACRNELAASADPELALTSWGEVADRIDRPSRSVLERVLGRLGASSGSAQLVDATPGLRSSGLLGLILLTGVAVATAREVDATGPFLFAAPLVPLVAVALTFLPAANPAGEAALATPVHGAGLLLRRAAVLLPVVLVLLLAGTLAMPGIGLASLAWLLPASALTASCLALGTWIRMEHSLAALTLAWCGVVGLVVRLDWRVGSIADSPPFGTVGQLVAFGLTVVGLSLIAGRFDRLANPGVMA